MKALEVFKLINEEKQYKLVRERKDCPNEYDVKDDSGSKKNWVFVDGTTASVVLNVYKAISEEHKIIFEKFSLMKMINVSWKAMHGGN